MPKSRDARKETRKAPKKSMKEKRNSKLLRKHAAIHPEFLPRNTHGLLH